MVLSRLVLDLQDPAARRDLSNRYEMHRTLARLDPSGEDRLLWHLEMGKDHAPRVLIQTRREPDPAALRGTGGSYYLSFESRPNKLLDNLRSGDLLRFRVLANASVKRDGRRHGLYRSEDQHAWIERQLTKHGATPLAVRVIGSSTERCWRGRGRRPITVFGVMFEGMIDVIEPDAFRRMVCLGLGHAKGLGFGLLTLGR